MNLDDESRNRLEQTFLNFARLLKERFAKLSSDGKPLMLTRHRRRFDWDKPFEDIEILDTTAYYSIGQERQWQDVDAVRECVELHVDAGIASVSGFRDSEGIPAKNPEYETHAWHSIVELQLPVIRAVDRFRQVAALTDENLLECYREYVNYWTATESRIDHLVPLKNLQLVSGPLQIDEHTLIEKLSAELASELFYCLGDLHPMSVDDFADADSILVVTDVRRRGDPDKGNEILEKIISIVTALRLNGYECGAKCDFNRRNAPQPQSVGPIGVGYLDALDVPRHTQTSQLDAQSPIAIRECIEAISATSDLQVKLALRRFNLAFGRDDPEDKVIDLTIALESLLVGEPLELNYRLGLAASHLLRGKQHPQTTFDTLKAMYGLRSAIVHKGDRLRDPHHNQTKRNLRKVSPTMNVSDAVEKFREITRLVLLEVVERTRKGRSLADIREELQQSALGPMPDDNGNEAEKA